MGMVYPNKASFSLYLRSIPAEENPQGPMKAAAQGTKVSLSLSNQNQFDRLLKAPVVHVCLRKVRNITGAGLQCIEIFIIGFVWLTCFWCKGLF